MNIPRNIKRFNGQQEEPTQDHWGDPHQSHSNQRDQLPPASRTSVSAGSIRIGFVKENWLGHTTFHHRLLTELAADGRTACSVLDIGSGGLLRRALTAPLPLPRGMDFDAPLFRNQVGQSAAAWWRLRSFVKSNDVIHMYSQNAAPLVIGQLRRLPLIVSSDGTCEQTSEKFSFRYPGRGAGIGVRLSAAVERRLLSVADAVIAQSNWARNAFIECDVPAERVHVVRIGAPIPRLPIVRPERSSVRVVFVGATMKRKGGWALVEALRDMLGSTVELHLVTHDRVTPRPGVVVHDDIWPNDGRIEEVLDSADIFALPTDMDMSPNAVLEAMASGLPIVSTNCGAIPEMVAHGQNGYLSAPGDARGLRDSLIQLINSPERRVSFGQYSREILAERFNQARAVDEFVQIVVDVVKRDGQSRRFHPRNRNPESTSVTRRVRGKEARSPATRKRG